MSRRHGWIATALALTIAQAQPLAAENGARPAVAICTPPGIPTNVTGSASGPAKVRIAWTPGQYNWMYRVYRATGGCAASGPFPQVANDILQASYDDIDLTPGSSFGYRVAGVDPTGFCDSAPSTCLEVAVPTPVGLLSFSVD